MWCHITNVVAQGNQLRRALEYKMENGQEQEVKEMVEKVGMLGAGAGAAILSGPYIRQSLSNANLGIISTVAAAPAGPFTVHFWYVKPSIHDAVAVQMRLDRETLFIVLLCLIEITWLGLVLLYDQCN